MRDGARGRATNGGVSAGCECWLLVAAPGPSRRTDHVPADMRAPREDVARRLTPPGSEYDEAERDHQDAAESCQACAAPSNALEEDEGRERTDPGEIHHADGE